MAMTDLCVGTCRHVLRALLVVGAQSCYGHTEGTAGVTGMLLALCITDTAACPPFVNLRDINPYVAAALTDWSAKDGRHILVPRQFGPSLLVGEVRLVSHAHTANLAVAYHSTHTESQSP